MFYRKHERALRALAAVLVDEGFGRRTVARELGLSQRTAMRWVWEYRQRSRVWLRPMKSPTEYTVEIRVAAVRRHVVDGVAKPDVVREFNITSPSSLDQWVTRWREGGDDALVMKRAGRKKRVDSPESLEERVTRLEMENAVLKKRTALTRQQSNRK